MHTDKDTDNRKLSRFCHLEVTEMLFLGGGGVSLTVQTVKPSEANLCCEFGLYKIEIEIENVGI